MNNIISTMDAAMGESVRELRNGISNVKSALYETGKGNVISFVLNGQTYEGVLKGRNVDLCLGHGEIFDKAIAARVFLDGDAYEV